jgi:hypothetical protein
MRASQTPLARVWERWRLPWVLRRSAGARSAMKVLRRRSGSKWLACRGYEGEAVAELIGDPPSNSGASIESRAIWPGEMAGELEERNGNTVVSRRE